MKVIKRDGRVKDFDINKIINALSKAFVSCNNPQPFETYDKLASEVRKRINTETPTVEYIQDLVQQVLFESEFNNVATEYVLYRARRSRHREANTSLMHVLRGIDSSESSVLRENANVDGNTPMGVMLKYGSESAKKYYESDVIDERFVEAHHTGEIHIHDEEFYGSTTTCTQIDLVKTFKNGFNTGHGSIREPKSIKSYASLACIVIQSNQNDQHGGQSIANFDYGLAPGVAHTFTKELKKILDIHFINRDKSQGFTFVFEKFINAVATLESPLGDIDSLKDMLSRLLCLSENVADKLIDMAVENTDKETYQAMESLIHNLNTMHSRAGAQVPFSSINYGMATSEEARMVIKNVLLATESGLGNGETPIFPIQVFKVKEGINFNKGDINYDLYQLAIRCSAKRLFPNFVFQDAPFNDMYYKGTPETEIATMGCRTRVIGNTVDPDKAVTYGRGNLSFTSINLPRIAIKSKGDIEVFYDELERLILLVADQLMHRYKIQCNKTVINYPFLMGNHIWIDSETLNHNSTLETVLRHGTLSIGFIGLAEALKCLVGSHHGESDKAQKIGIEIIDYMRNYADLLSQRHNLNFTLLGTPAEGLSGRFVNIDKREFGIIEGVTDRDYYTNSFHVPVYHKITAWDKIRIEAPYHSRCNAGHITYVELDGDPLNNLEAFDQIIRFMHKMGIGYGSINHPVDRDPVCGYVGVINDVCPRCGRKSGESIPADKLSSSLIDKFHTINNFLNSGVGEGIEFERIRRITGYLVGAMTRWNSAKVSEEHDRVKHHTGANQ